MIRKLVEFSLDRPLLNHFLLLFILLLSIFAYINIPKEIFPPMQMDKISITGGYAGTSADVLDKMVVQTIEDDLKNISEIESVKTTIKNGFFSILAEIKPDSNNMNVLNDVKDIIANTKQDIPSDMSEPIAKIHVHDIPLVLIAIAGDYSTKVLLDRANELKSSLSKYKDLSEISIRGDSDTELVVALNEEKIRAYGIEFNSVVGAVQSLSSIFPIGTIKEQGKHLYISTYNGEKDLNKIENTIISVTSTDGMLQHIRVGDVSDIQYSLADESEISHYNSKRNVSINITKSKNGNAIVLVKEIREMLKEYEQKYPEFQFEIYTDTSIWIKNRLNTVFANILFGLMLVFMAMLIFVNRGIALVVSMGIPLSFMIGLIVTNAIGQSMNMLSLLGALIALGMLVDEAIVVAENIYRHLEEGKSRREAAILGTVEMFPAVLTATLTTIFAFLPLLMLTGEMGTFIKILPIMISVLLISSLFEAFFFLPLHSYDFLRLRKEDHMAHAIWDTLNSWHNSVLHFLFKRRILSLIVIFTSIIMATGMMMKSSKFQLFPDFDVTQIYITGKVNINNDLQDSEKIVTNVEKIILSKLSSEEYSSVTSVIGMRLDAKNEAELGDNLFHIFVDLHERAPDNFFNKYINPHFALEYDASILKRERTAHAISMDLEKWLKEVSEQSYHDRNFKEQKLFEEFQITVPGTGIVAHDIEISLGGQRGDVMVAGIKKLETSLSTIAGVDNISDDLEIGEEELKLRINSYGQQLGFTEASLTKELRAYYLKGEYGKLFNTQGLIRVRIEGNAKDSFSSIESFQVHIPNTKQYIALKEVCHFIVSKSYVSIKKEDSKRLRTVFASLDKKLSTSAEVMKALQPTIDALDASGYIVHVKGEQQENEKTQREMMQAGIIAILLIFITLVWLFNSIVKTLIVLSTIPLVLLGVYIGHWIMGLNLTMPGLIGVIGLAGVVVNDGLIMVSFISKAKDSEDLMRLAKTRLRPILLTSITTVLGLSTLIFFASGQAQILQPMAISLGFGITWATVLNLVYIPLLYSVVYRVKR